MAIAIMAWLVGIPLLGVNTGVRTMTPMAVLCWFAYLGNLDLSDTWGFWAAKPLTLAVFTTLAIGELIGDKRPKTPDRTSAGPLIARLVFGGLVGALAATGLKGSALEGIILGSLGALGGAFFGFHMRRSCVERTGWPDWRVALLEDTFAVGMSFLAMGIITG